MSDYSDSVLFIFWQDLCIHSNSSVTRHHEMLTFLLRFYPKRFWHMIVLNDRKFSFDFKFIKNSLITHNISSKRCLKFCLQTNQVFKVNYLSWLVVCVCGGACVCVHAHICLLNYEICFHVSNRNSRFLKCSLSNDSVTSLTVMWIQGGYQ